MSSQIQEIFSDLPEHALQILAPAWSELKQAISDISADLHELSPAPKDVLRVFRETQNIKLVLLGQDPYPNGADGLAFSCEKIRPSVKAIFACLEAKKLMNGTPANGDLSRWAQQGVLLLNTALTTRLGKADAHSAAWKKFTEKLIESLASRRPSPGFILLGKHAQKYEKLILKHQGTYFSWVHPSPLAATSIPANSPAAFINCPCFEQANNLLESQGTLPVNWGILTEPEENLVEAEEFICGFENSNNTIKPEIISSKSVVNPLGTLFSEKSYYVPELSDEEMRILKDAERIWIFTDGGAVHGNNYTNSGPSWVAAWGVHVRSAQIPIAERSCLVSGGGTNNRAELQAMIVGFAFAEIAINADPRKPITICYDSQYAAQSLTNPAWGKPTSSSGAARVNWDMIGPARTWILPMIPRVTLRHIKSHQKIRPADPGLAFLFDGNARVDTMCTELLTRK